MRYATRQPYALLPQQPQRRTRNVPLVGPRGVGRRQLRRDLATSGERPVHRHGLSGGFRRRALGAGARREQSQGDRDHHRGGQEYPGQPIQFGPQQLHAGNRPAVVTFSQPVLDTGHAEEADEKDQKSDGREGFAHRDRKAGALSGDLELPAGDQHQQRQTGRRK